VSHSRQWRNKVHATLHGIIHVGIGQPPVGKGRVLVAEGLPAAANFSLYKNEKRQNARSKQERQPELPLAGDQSLRRST
jgi:hypothetical protein